MFVKYLLKFIETFLEELKLNIYSEELLLLHHSLSFLLFQCNLILNLYNQIIDY